MRNVKNYEPIPIRESNPYLPFEPLEIAGIVACIEIFGVYNFSRNYKTEKEEGEVK